MSILIEATVTLRPVGGDAVARFVRTYSEVEHPTIARHGFDLIGAWAAASGAVGRVIHLYRLPDLAAYERARGAIRDDPDFLPTVVAGYGPDLTIRETVACGQPLPHVLLDRAPTLGPDSDETTYVRTTISVELRDLARLAPVLAQVHGQIEAATAMRLVAAYLPVFGDRNSVVIYWRAPEGRASLAAAAAAVDPATLADLRALIQDEAFDLLRPLPYSPTAMAAHA